jgi:hypothetical protein
MLKVALDIQRFINNGLRKLAVEKYSGLSGLSGLERKIYDYHYLEMQHFPNY